MPPTPTTLDELDLAVVPSDPHVQFAPPTPRRHRRRRRVIAVIVVIVVTGGAVGAAWNQQWYPFAADDADAAEASTSTRQLVAAEEGSVTSTVSAESTVAAAETESLAFAAAGTVSEVLVAEGDTVTAGQVVARLDSASLRADVADAEATVAELEAQLDTYSEELWEFRSDGDNDDEDDTYDDGDLLEDQAASTLARLEVASDTLANANEALEGAVLTASIDGTVTSLGISVGEQLGSGGSGSTTLTGSGTDTGNTSGSIGSNTVIPGATTSTSDSSSTAIEIVSTGRYQVELALDSTDIVGVEVGQEVSVVEATSSSSGAFGAFPGGGAFPSGAFPGGGAFPSGALPGGGLATDEDAAGPTAVTGGASAVGVVTEVSDVADASSGVASYSVIVEFADEAGNLYIGTSVLAEITTSTRSGVVLVPSLAVTTENGTSTVQVATDGTVDGSIETRTVTTGATSGNRIEISSGLAAGEQVVIEFATGQDGGFPGGGQLPDGFPQGGQLPEGFPAGGTPSEEGSE